MELMGCCNLLMLAMKQTLCIAEIDNKLFNVLNNTQKHHYYTEHIHYITICGLYFNETLRSFSNINDDNNISNRKT